MTNPYHTYLIAAGLPQGECPPKTYTYFSLLRGETVEHATAGEAQARSKNWERVEKDNPERIAYLENRMTARRIGHAAWESALRDECRTLTGSTGLLAEAQYQYLVGAASTLINERDLDPRGGDEKDRNDVVVDLIRFLIPTVTNYPFRL